MTQAELGHDRGQTRDRAGGVPVRNRAALVQVHVPARAIVTYQDRADRVLHEQRVQPLRRGRVIALRGCDEDPGECRPEHPERVQVMMGPRPAQGRVVGHERTEFVRAAKLVGLAFDANGRVHEAHRQLGIGREIHCGP